MAVKKLKLVSSSIIAEADALAVQHENFTEQYVTRANDELYKLLGRIFSVCLQVEANATKESVINQMRKTLREKYNIRTQKNSVLSGIVVRYIVRSSRKTAYIYGKVIEAAIKDGVKADGLVDYIRNKGGIEALRKSVVNAEAVKQDKAYNKLALKLLANQLEVKPALGTIAFTDKSYSQFASTSDVSFTYLICTNDKSGNLQVVGSLYPSSTLEQQALELFNTTCFAAAIDDGSVKFGEYCKERSLSMDLVHKWGKANGLTTAANKAALEPVNNSV